MRDRTVDIIIIRQLVCHCEVSLNELQDFITCHSTQTMHKALAVEIVTVYSLDGGKPPHVQFLHKVAHLKLTHTIEIFCGGRFCYPKKIIYDKTFHTSSTPLLINSLMWGSLRLTKLEPTYCT